MDLILFLIGLMLMFVFFPISIIITIVKAVKKKDFKVWGFTILGSFFGAVTLILISFSIPSSESSNEISTSDASKSEVITVEEKKEEINNQLSDNNISKENNSDEEIVYIQNQESTESENIETENIVEEKTENEIESIFYGEIGLNKTYYNGKTVTTSIKCSYGDGETEKISSESNMCYGGLDVVFTTPQNIPSGEYVTVSGVVGEEYGATALKNSVVICKGEEAKANYENEFNVFKEEFMNAETVSYEDLLRYPDTYCDKKIKLDVNITDVESDGIVFNGTITGVVPGTDNEIAIYDYRENREPRIKENDKLTIYATGNKTITVKLKDGKGLFAETVDEYEIPCVYLQFIDFR